MGSVGNAYDNAIAESFFGTTGRILKSSVHVKKRLSEGCT